MGIVIVGRNGPDGEPIFGIKCLICGQVEKLAGPWHDGLAICQECRRRIHKTIYPEREGTNE